MKKQILLMAVAVMMLIPVQLAAGNSHEGDADVLYIEELTVKSGEDFEIAVNFRNANTYSAFQCDILIPEGIEVEKDEDGEFCFSMEESRFTSKHSISSSLLGDGYIRVASYANPTKDMNGNDGALFYIKARAKENFSGEGVIRIKNIKFSTAEGVESELLNTETVINIISNVNGDADVLYIEELTVKSGEDFEIAVNFRNANTYSAFQCDILIPEGIEVEKDEDGEFCFSMEESRFTSKHSISSSLLGDGYIRVASYANPTKDMNGNDGALFYIKARAKENFSGEGVIRIKNIKFSTAEGVESELLNTETVINIIPTVNEFAINDVTVTDCYTLQLPVELNNDSKIVSLDAELSLPDGMSFSGVELNPSRCDDSFSVTTSQNNDIINIKLASSASSAVAGSAGILFHLNLVQEPNSGSEKVVTLKNIIATTDDGGVIAIKDANCTVTFIINSYTLTYMVDGEVYATVQVKYGEEIIPIEEPVMDGYTFSGWGEIPETMPAEDVVISGVFTANETCVAPVISYSDGCLNITSETENAEIHTTITCSDADSYIGGKIELSSTYLITSYATKPKCANSELVTATLCWIAVSSGPGVTDIIEVEALPVLITCKDGEINIRGGQEGANVIVYDTNGVMIGNTTITNSNAIVNTSLAKGEAAIVNVAGKAVKVVMQ